MKILFLILILSLILTSCAVDYYKDYPYHIMTGSHKPDFHCTTYDPGLRIGYSCIDQNFNPNTFEMIYLGVYDTVSYIGDNK